MIDLTDLTIIIPFKYDTEDRINNLRFILRFYQKYFSNYKFIIIESGPIQKGAEFNNLNNVTYFFTLNNNAMHRTKMLNDGAKLANTKFIACYDTDVFFKPENLKDTMIALNSGKNFVLPFNGIFLNIFDYAKNQVTSSLNYKFLPTISHNLNRDQIVQEGVKCVVNNSVGGATFFNKNVFLKLGGYNENFISWGYEDNEIFYRFKTMDNQLFNIQNSNCYHLNHARGKDSQMVHDFTVNNKNELAKVISMNKDKLKDYIINNLIKS